MPTAIRGLPPQYDPIERLPAPLKGLVRAFFPANDVSIPISPMVAGVKPNMIPLLKQHGKKMLRKLQLEGLRDPSKGATSIYGDILGLRPDFRPNISASPELMQALEFAQKRYPRVFGHIKRIEAVPENRREFTIGSAAPSSELGSKMTKSLRVNPIEGRRSMMPYMVGHELLHVGDTIAETGPTFIDKYKHSLSLPGGYEASAREKRADLMGEIFAEHFRTGKHPLRKK